MLLKLDVMLPAVNLILLRHGKLLRCYEMECRIEVAHCCDERMHGTSVLQVADKVDVKVFQCALSLVYRVKVEQTL